MEDVVATPERIGPFDCEHVTGLFDNTEDGSVTSRITTQRTDTVVLRDIATLRAERQAGLHREDGLHQAAGILVGLPH